MPDLALTLDGHYPESVSRRLTDQGIDAVGVIARQDLRGRPDADVLAAATDEGRAVVTEDVTTFPAAILAVPNRAGVIFCDAQRFPRTVPALPRLESALVAFVRTPPEATRYPGFIWWLAPT